MKQFFYFLMSVIFVSGLLFGQNENGTQSSDDSEETRLEQTLAAKSEKFEVFNPIPLITDASFQVTHPLFVGVDDVTISTYVGNPATNEWLPAFIGAQVWGAAYDNVNDIVYFNSGASLYSWAVGSGTFDTLGTITDSLAANQSLVSLAFYDGVLYGTKNIANEAVYEINLSTLVATPIIDYVDADFDFGGLAIDPNTGEFYGTNDDATPFGSGLFKINLDGTATLVAPYPAGESDIDGLAVSNTGMAYLVIDQPGNIYTFDLITATYGDTLTSPWTTSEVFSGATWIYESGSGMGVMLVSDNTTGTDSVEARLNVLGETYTRVTNTTALSMPVSDWLMYDAVFWIGLVSTAAEVDSCIEYLNAGGRLLIQDNDQGYFTGTSPLFLDYLMATYQSDNGSDGTIQGLEMMDGITLDISADPYPDDVLPNAGTYGTGIPIFLAPTTTTYAGMRGDGGTFRTQLLCWDPQYGDSYSENLSIISRTIAWLANGIIPVELTSFKSSINGNAVTLFWETATEVNNSGFMIQRKLKGDDYTEIGFVPGFGTTAEPKKYSFADNNLNSGSYSYRLKQIDFDGTFSYSDEIEVEIVAPIAFGLDQNYPNPFNPTTKISFSLPSDSKITLKVFDILGQEVITLINGNLASGVHTYDFNAKNLNSGVYFYKLEAAGQNGVSFTDVKKMILIK